MELLVSPEPNLGAARGRRDKVTPAQVEFREGVREAQITALEREVANLKAQSQASSASTIPGG